MKLKLKAQLDNFYDGFEKASDETGLKCLDKTRTQQHFKEECDINTIVHRFGLTGMLPQGVRMPTYGDFTGVNDYQTALNAILAADDAFMAMPAHVRERFQNDPAKFVDFCSDEKNRDEAVKLGLVPAAVHHLVNVAPSTPGFAQDVQEPSPGTTKTPNAAKQQTP